MLILFVDACNVRCTEKWKIPFQKTCFNYSYSRCTLLQDGCDCVNKNAWRTTGSVFYFMRGQSTHSNTAVCFLIYLAVIHTEAQTIREGFLKIFDKQTARIVSMDQQVC